MNRLHGLHWLAALSVFMALFTTGCCTTYPGASYVESDEATYNYAQPKLEEWAEAKGGDWPAIVKNKGIAWKAKFIRAKEAGAGDQDTE